MKVTTATKRISKHKLSDDEMHCIRTHIINSKLQHRAILYANISYAKFRNIIDHNSGMTKEQYARLMEFCRSTKASNIDF